MQRPGVADVLTLGNACAGAGAVLVVVLGADWEPELRLRVMALLLVVATALDVVDGVAARRWGGTALGRPLDALADATSFGVAPAVAVAAYVLSRPGPLAPRLLVAAAALAYVAAALLRLAGFLAGGTQDHFVGLPTTAAAILALDIAFLTAEPVLVAVGLLVLAVLMVSLLPYPMQRSRVIAGWSLAGWGLGLVGIVGLVDVRIPAALSLLGLAVAVPYALRRRDHATGTGRGPLAEVD